MSTKPFRKKSSDEPKIETSHTHSNEFDEKRDEVTQAPFREVSQEPINLSDAILPEDILKSHQTHFSFRRLAHFFSTLNGLLMGLILFVFIVVIADTIETVNQLLSSASLSQYLYLSGLLLLLGILLLNLHSNIKQYQRLKNIKTIKNKLEEQKSNPNKTLIPLISQLLERYESLNDPKLKENIERIKEEMNISPIYSHLYQQFDTDIVSVIDEKAKKLIFNASIQTSLSTAVSPVPLVDMFLIVWRSLLLAKEISALYGFRAGGLTTILLLKQGIMNVVFAGVAELALDYANEMTSTTIVSKVSSSAAQGLFNGVLIARLGYGIMAACRPIDLSKKRENYFKQVMNTLYSTISNK